MFLNVVPFLLLATGLSASSLPFKKNRQIVGRNEQGSVHATLSRVNTTHCAVDLSNQGESVDFLKWNSLFDSQTESFSFTVEKSTTKEKMPVGSTMLRKIYAEVQPHHVLNIAAHSSWRGEFDLTQLFEIPEEGEYDVSLTSTLTAVASVEKSHKPYQIEINTHPATMKLAKSPSVHQRRWPDLSDNARIHSCDAAQQWVIQKTVAQAADLAMNAKKAVPLTNPIVGYNPNPELYQQYFNDNSQQTVFEVFDRASKYDLMANPGLGLTFYCSTDAMHTDSCSAERGLIGYAPAIGAYAYVTLCDSFFEDIWSSTLCSVPGTTTPPDGTTVNQWQIPTMQAGIALHEMLHCYIIVRRSTIVDGPDPKNQGGVNYLYGGVSENALNSASNGDAPLTNSQNFVFFAQAATNAVAPLSCNCCSFGGPTLSLCSGLPNSPACGTCTCGGSDPN